MIMHKKNTVLFGVMLAAVVFCGQHLFAGSVTFSVSGARSEQYSPQGNPVYEVYPGQKFKISVISSGLENLSGRPDVPGLSSFKTLSTSQSSNLVSINGRVTNTWRFEYFLMGEDEGEFTLGPVTTAHGTSATCIIRVRQRSTEEEHKDFEKEYERGAVCQAQLALSKKEYFVGEPIPVTLQVFCWDANVELEAIQPNFEGFTVQEGASNTTELEHDGKKVRVLKKEYILTSLWAGEKKIKPVNVVYNVPSDDFDDFGFGGSPFRGAFFFGPQKMVNRAEVQSNGLQFELKNLPAADRACDGLGKFSALVLSVDKNIADVKALLNISLKVVGKGNFTQVSAPRLKLPKSMRAFPGCTEGDLVKREDNSGDFEKKFTYVVQPMKPGVVTIPSQEFFYFDPEAGSYHTLRSREVTLVVEGEEETVPRAQEEASAVAGPAVEQKKVQETENPETWSEDGTPTRSWRIGWSLWLMLVFMLVVFGLLYERLVEWAERQRNNPKRALPKALRALDGLKTKSVNALFEISINFLRMRFFDAGRQHLALEEIDAALEKTSLKAERRAEFMQFLTILAGLAFGSLKTLKTYDQLAAELKAWMEELNGF